MQAQSLKYLASAVVCITLLCASDDLYAQGRGNGHHKDKGNKEKKGGGPPPWAPAHGYRAKTRHIYFPAQQMYYDLQKGTYIYMSSGTWQVSVSLPSIFQGINLNTANKIELDLDGDNPQRLFEDHKKKYKQ